MDENSYAQVYEYTTCCLSTFFFEKYPIWWRLNGHQEADLGFLEKEECGWCGVFEADSRVGGGGFLRQK